MKKILLITLLFSTLVYSTDKKGFTINSYDPDIDIEKIGGTHVKPTKFMDDSYLSIADRDYFLDQYFADDIKSWDNFDRDMLYKKLLHYKKKQVLKRYSFVTSDKYDKIREEFLQHPTHSSHFERKKKKK